MTTARAPFLDEAVSTSEPDRDRLAVLTDLGLIGQRLRDAASSRPSSYGARLGPTSESRLAIEDVRHTEGVPHPRMYDPDDPLLVRVREIALAFPGSDEKESHGRPAFFTRKVFCYYGGSAKVDGVWIQHDQAIVFLPDPVERPALESDSRFWVPVYLGPSGWLALDIAADSDFAEVAELLEESYRLTAPSRLIEALDESV